MNRKKRFPLHVAAEKGDSEEIIKYLSKKNGPVMLNTLDDQKNVPLYYAAINGHCDTVQQLLTYNAGENFADPVIASRDSTVLLLLSKSIKGDSPSFPIIVRTLLMKGININFQNGEGNTSLHFICEKPNMMTCLDTLIENGANLNIKNNAGETPLMRTLKRDERMAKRLIEKGAEEITKHFDTSLSPMKISPRFGEARADSDMTRTSRVRVPLNLTIKSEEVHAQREKSSSPLRQPVETLPMPKLSLPLPARSDSFSSESKLLNIFTCVKLIEEASDIMDHFVSICSTSMDLLRATLQNESPDPKNILNLSNTMIKMTEAKKEWNLEANNVRTLALKNLNSRENSSAKTVRHENTISKTQTMKIYDVKDSDSGDIEPMEIQVQNARALISQSVEHTKKIFSNR